MTQQTDHIGDTNKMVTMKLYTESQVIDAISKAFRYKSNVEILKSLKPIELPSDEEIEKRSKYWNETTNPDMWTLKLSWKAGAKWMKDKIQGGDK